MTSTCLRLLSGFLLRSAWLYSGVGLMQYLLTDLYWKEGIARVSVPAGLLGLWGIGAAINKYNLVSRSLPLSNREASIFRWWTIVAAPGLWLTLCDAIAWASQRTSPGVSAPPLSSLMQSILLGWAAIGAIAILPSIRRKVRGSVAALIITALTAIYALWILYGLPAYAAWPPVSLAMAAVGAALLLFSGVEAARGRLWHWPDIAIGGVRHEGRGATRSAKARFGVSVIVVPLLRRTLLFAAAATGGAVLLYRLFPGAGAWIFWSYFLAISTTGFLLTYQVRSAIQTLRILPLSAEQLAARLQLFGALPGMVTLGLALLLNVVLLHLQLDPLEFATFALIAVAAQTLPIQESPRARMSAAVLKWVRLLQRLYLPFYMGVVVLSYGGIWAKWWWFKWPVIALGMVLCLVGHYTLVRQLRMGVRPAGNEGVFSAR
jgi:hypothetical protein